MTLELLNDAHLVYDLGAQTWLAVPSPLDRANQPIGGWSTLWLDVLRYKMRFSLPELIMGLCHCFDLVSSQLMPHVWRVVAMIEVMDACLKLVFDVDDLLFTYLLAKSHPGQYRLGK